MITDKILIKRIFIMLVSGSKDNNQRLLIRNIVGSIKPNNQSNTLDKQVNTTSIFFKYESKIIKNCFTHGCFQPLIKIRF